MSSHSKRSSRPQVFLEQSPIENFRLDQDEDEGESIEVKDSTVMAYSQEKHVELQQVPPVHREESIDPIPINTSQVESTSKLENDPDAF